MNSTDLDSTTNIDIDIPVGYSGIMGLDIGDMALGELTI